MILIVSGDAVNMPVDQRVEFIDNKDSQIRVTLLGTGKSEYIWPQDIKGMELEERTIFFMVLNTVS